MSRKFIVASTLTLLTIAALTGTVLAATLTPFTASGSLLQTNSGTTSTQPLVAAQPFVPAALYGLVEGLVPFGSLTPGNLTTGQVFTGAVGSTDWDDLEDAGIVVNQNSWFTADVASLFPPTSAPAVPSVGLAWGTFTAAEDDDDSVTGGYAALIQGLMSLNAECVSPANPLGLAIQIQDDGGWQVLSATGDLRAVNPAGGTLSVQAAGCLYQESGLFTLTGAHSDGDRGEDSRSDRGRERGEDDSRKSDGRGDSNRSDRGYERGRDRG